MSIPPRNRERYSAESQTQPPPKPYSDMASSSSSSSFTAPPSMGLFVIPPGYKFKPTDEDLILHYLNPFLHYKILPPNIPIHRVNIYESNPEQLSKGYEKGNKKEWFFITERTKKIEGGKHLIRSDNGGGSWKATQVGKKIEAGDGLVAYKNSLQYLIGKAKGDWLMHEYWLHSERDNKVDHALCKIYLTPKAAKRRAEEAENENKKKKKILIEEVVEAVEEEDKFSLLPLESSEFDDIFSYFGNLEDDELRNCIFLEEIFGEGAQKQDTD